MSIIATYVDRHTNKIPNCEFVIDMIEIRKQGGAVAYVMVSKDGVKLNTITYDLKVFDKKKPAHKQVYEALKKEFGTNANDDPNGEALHFVDEADPIKDN